MSGPTQQHIDPTGGATLTGAAPKASAFGDLPRSVTTQAGTTTGSLELAAVNLPADMNPAIPHATMANVPLTMTADAADAAEAPAPVSAAAAGATAQHRSRKAKHPHHAHMSAHTARHVAEHAAAPRPLAPPAANPLEMIRDGIGKVLDTVFGDKPAQAAPPVQTKTGARHHHHAHHHHRHGV